MKSLVITLRNYWYFALFGAVMIYTIVNGIIVAGSSNSAIIF
jgi:hypothetical protein